MSTSSEQTIIFDNVSKFYGEILGVNRVTSPSRSDYQSGWSQWSGQVDLDEFNDRLLRPSRGQVTVLGVPTDQPEKLFRK